MKKRIGAVLSLTLSLAFLGIASAGEKKEYKPIEVSDKVTVKATVEAINHANRSVTIKGPKGEAMTVAVDESVERFDQIRVGDEIKATYYESVVLELRKPGDPVPSESIGVAAAAAPGTKPAGVAAAQSVTTVTIVNIDPETPAVTVRSTDGSLSSFRVRKKKNLKGVEVGDQVVITQSEALVISVEGKK